ncbi:uncharacterized protein NP_2580A [Natronomonas pharaonis DSM 2160]|uniref:Uncharacterized protein n=1 Tax=Natronomonas pharaonis (strain ATCC 35678 / DSM 2160 / CIP 103997 / JCM 8858 / NBRC 14720 / NCIMB 2260 / Gabara) TaxID=348780 RepID=A0A1U7EWC4_NATPD|nr:hypothetical protein [Natronomonas pharaonis]CAI49381.1 uncharacterized protein NP_2580A [Natronomonas pharaonis DSM 2160]
MGAVTTSLDEEARTIFRDLGYEVTTENDELRAERKWRTVHVTTADPEEANTYGRLRCFVADADRAGEVRDRLLGLEPDYDWAVMSVEDGDYQVLHPSADVLPAP